MAGVRMRNVRAVSMGDRMIADREVEMKDRRSVTTGEVDVKMSAVMEDEISSSGKPTMADSRLRMNVFNVGRSREYMKVVLVPFHGDVGPLVVHSWDNTSIREDWFLMAKACREEGLEDGM